VTEKEQVNVSDKSSLIVLNFSTNDANNPILKSSIGLPLSHGECSTDLCDKEELCDSGMIIHVQQLVNENAFFVLEQNTLNTLGYIEFETLCALSSLEKKFLCAELPWLSTCIYQFIDKYNYKGEYMVHQVYICSNLKSPFSVHQYDQSKGRIRYNHVILRSPSFVIKKQAKF
jgi:hypothetical protein